MWKESKGVIKKEGFWRQICLVIYVTPNKYKRSRIYVSYIDKSIDKDYSGVVNISSFLTRGFRSDAVHNKIFFMWI